MFPPREPTLRHILPCLTVVSSIVWFVHLSGTSGQIMEYGIVINVTSSSTINVPEWGNVTITAQCESVPNASHETLIRNNRPVLTTIVDCRCHKSDPACTFTLRNVSRAMSGTYIIYVNNTQGLHKSVPTQINVQYAPVCILHRPQLSVIESQTVTFSDLSVPANPRISSVQWQHQGNPINTTDPRYSGGTGAIPSLTITNVNSDDAGMYNFTASNIVGRLVQSNCSLNLTVNYGPYLNCSAPPVVTINETDSYTFAINVVSYPVVSRVIWFKGSNPIQRNGRFVQGNVNIPSLTLNNANRTDTGSYSVNVTNSLTRRFVYGCHTNLTVQYRPSCRLHVPTPNDVAEGSSVTIRVTLTSSPPPTFVDWDLNGTSISRNDSHYNGGNVTVPSLTIRDIRRHETGSYSIQADNIVGGVVDNCQVFLRVLYRPECIILSNTTLRVAEYSSVTISAAIDAVTSPNTVDWKFNNIPISRTGGRYAGGNSYQNPSLIIPRITRSDAGVYSLTASNVVGSVVNESNCNVNVVVQYLDACPNRTYSVCLNGTRTLQCSVRFRPSLTNVTWKKNGVILNVSDPRYSGGTASSPDLTISNIVPTDDDVYTCEVENVVGVAGCHITLDVLSLPDVQVPLRNIMLVEGQTSSVGCSVDMRVDPRPAAVHWFKDGVHLDTRFGRYGHGDINNPSLTIVNIRREDVGTYTCGAVNGVGNSHSEAITVTVEYPPTVLVRYNNYGLYDGSDATLWCYVNSYPLVAPQNITWVRDGQFVIPSTSCSDVRPSLRLCRIDTSTAGQYICRARHRLAFVNSAIITIHVRDTCATIVDSVTLTDSTNTNAGCVSGRLQVRLRGTSSRGTVCGRTWTSAETEVVCGMMGYRYGASSMRSGGVGTIHLGDVACLPGATTLNDCRLSSVTNCTHDYDIWLTCCENILTSPAQTTTIQTTTTTSPTAVGITEWCWDAVIALSVVVVVLLLVIVGMAACLICGSCCSHSIWCCPKGRKTWCGGSTIAVHESGTSGCTCPHRPHCCCSSDAVDGRTKYDKGHQIQPRISNNRKGPPAFPGEFTDSNIPSKGSRGVMPANQEDSPRYISPSKENGTDTAGGDGGENTYVKAWKEPGTELHSKGMTSVEQTQIPNSMPTDDEVNDAIEGRVPRRKKKRKKKSDGYSAIEESSA